MEWEGAELCFYMNGESHAIGLSDTQFALIAKLLGMKYNYSNQEVSFFSDSTLKQIAEMKGNPLKLREE